MALDRFAVVALKRGFANSAAGQEIATLLALRGVGAPHTISARTKRIIKTAYRSAPDANAFLIAVRDSSALAPADVAKLGVALSNRRAATLIALELVAAP